MSHKAPVLRLREIGVDPIDGLADLRQADARFLAALPQLIAQGLRGQWALVGVGAEPVVYADPEQARRDGVARYGEGRYLVELIEEKYSDLPRTAPTLDIAAGWPTEAAAGHPAPP